MPLDGCRNLHRWAKDQNQRRQSGNPPSDPSVPGLLGFEKEQDLQETKVYVRALWLATENARLAKPHFLDNNACELLRRTEEIVTEYTRNVDKLCAELAKDDIAQIDSGFAISDHGESQACARSAFLREDVERILIDEGFGELIWGRRNARSSQLINPHAAGGEKAPRWSGKDSKGVWRLNQRDEIILTVRHWVAARIQNTIKKVPATSDRQYKARALFGTRKLDQPRRTEQQARGLDAKIPNLKAFCCAQCRRQNKQCQHKENHPLAMPGKQRHDSPNEQLVGEIWSSNIRNRDKISILPGCDQESPVCTEQTGISTDESLSKIQSLKRKRSNEHMTLQFCVFEQLKDASALEEDNHKYTILSTVHYGGHKLSALNTESVRHDAQKLPASPVASGASNDTQKIDQRTRQKSQNSNIKDTHPFSQTRDTTYSTDENKSVALKTPSTEPTSECSSVDFTRFLDADEELTQKWDGDDTVDVLVEEDHGGAEEHRLPTPSDDHTQHDHAPETHRDTIDPTPNPSHPLKRFPPTVSDTQIASARRDLQKALSLTLERKPRYASTLATLIPRAKHLYEKITDHTPSYFSPAFEQNELALVYWETLMTKLLTPTPLPALKAWHRELLAPWPDRYTFGLESWMHDLVVFFAVMLGRDAEEGFEAELMEGLVEYNRALWDIFAR